MKYSGKALRAGLKLIVLTLFIVVVIGLVILGVAPAVHFVAWALVGLWFLFTLFTCYFFRDPTAQTPVQAGIIACPAHGTVDVIDEVEETQFIKGRCHRISIFLSVVNVHVQNAPISGKVTCVTHTSGQFVNAMRTDSAQHNENVLIGIESSETPGERVGARLIAGLIARRIVPFITPGETVERGQRVSLIQFGSRCDLYIPLHYKIQAKLGDKVVGGETIMAIKS